MQLCVIIVTFNRLEQLKLALAAYCHPSVAQLVVVNNASNDGTADYLAQYAAASDTQVDVLNLPENTGGAGGFAAGIDYARQHSSADWLVLADDDAYPAADALDRFAEHWANQAGEAAIVASAVYLPDGDICKMNTPVAQASWWGSLRNIITRRSPSAVATQCYQQRQPLNVMAASFVGMFISLRAVKASGLTPPAHYFLYWDDIAYCLDMGAAGYSVQFDPRIHYIHACQRQVQQLSAERLYYLVRNGRWALAKLPLTIRLIYTPLKLLSWLLLALRNKHYKTYISALRDSSTQP